MSYRIEIVIEDGLPGKGANESRMQVRLESKYTENATERELAAGKYVIDEFEEAQLRYGRMMGATRTECARRDRPNGT